MTREAVDRRREPLSPRQALAAHLGGVLWAALLIVGLAITLARLAKDWLGT